MADGTEFVFWEESQSYTKTYYVNCNDVNADEAGKGSIEKPFKTINAAAQLLKAGERVIIKGGVYRESIVPRFGGSSADCMISYEAAEGEEVIVKGSVVIDSGWKKSDAWRECRHDNSIIPNWKGEKPIWELDIDGSIFGGYNPFGLLNLQGTRNCINWKKFDYESSLLNGLSCLCFLCSNFR